MLQIINVIHCSCLFILVFLKHVLMFSALIKMLLIYKSANFLFRFNGLLFFCFIGTGRQIITVIDAVPHLIYTYFWFYYYTTAPDSCFWPLLQLVFLKVRSFPIYSDDVKHLFKALCPFLFIHSCIPSYHSHFHFIFVLFQVPFSLWWIHQP